ncbi:hypothetical protein [Rothia uropygialis]|uniref:hypothetical protein n=1 Tax=Kocuria sp. 36 TaxID=1415402 RepID=UPI00101DE11A|nr:hypothetical protein [Kocuria sp. 36]
MTRSAVVLASLRATTGEPLRDSLCVLTEAGTEVPKGSVDEPGGAVVEQKRERFEMREKPDRGDELIWTREAAEESLMNGSDREAE